MAVTLAGIDLPIDLIWKDEYGWSNITQSIKKSLTGALIIQEASQPKGRLFTLIGGQDAAWVTKTTLELLEAQYNTPDNIMVLNFHGTSYNVMFMRSGNTSPIQTAEIYELADPDAEHVYGITLRLMEV